MFTRKRTISSMYLAALFGLSLFQMSSGCATTSEGTASGGEEIALSGPKPSGICEQYLALLSDARKQPLLAQYGTGGSCWTSGKQQEKQCDGTCREGVQQIIRANLNGSNG